MYCIFFCSSHFYCLINHFCFLLTSPRATFLQHEETTPSGKVETQSIAKPAIMRGYDGKCNIAVLLYFIISNVTEGLKIWTSSWAVRCSHVEPKKLYPLCQSINSCGQMSSIIAFIIPTTDAVSVPGRRSTLFPSRL